MRAWLARVARGEELPEAPEPYEGNLAPLYTCARWGRRDGIELLLAAGWDLNYRGEGYRAALDFPDMREFLLSKGVRGEIPDCDGQTMLFRADAERARAILQFGAEVNHQDREGRTVLWIAANRNRLELMNVLLAAGANPNLADAEGVTPLMKASTRRVRQRLLDEGAPADVAAFRSFCNRPEALMQLVEHLEFREVPLEFRLWYFFWLRRRIDFEGLCLGNYRELQPNRPVFRSQSVLWWAARLGSLSCCQLLMEHGWDPRRPDRDERTALHAAIDSRRPKVVRCLLAAFGPEDQLPLALARKRGDPNVIAVLRSHQEPF